MTKDKGRNGGLAWPPLVKGRLIRRYKRFLADVDLDDGRTVTAHCPNSGRMTGCSQAGRPVLLSEHHAPHRKLAFTWELIKMPSSWVGVNTQIPNKLVGRAVADGLVPSLAGYASVASEVRTQRHTRLDLKLSASGRRDCFVEVKNCTLVEGTTARFPDAPTARGRKHLLDLQRLVGEGHRAVIFFLIQRCDANHFEPANAIDPDYGLALRQAVSAGVELVAYDVVIDTRRIALSRRLPYSL